MINEIFAFITVTSFLGWVASVIAFIYKAFDEEGQFYPKPAIKIGLMILVFYALWIVGMLKA